MDHTHTHTHANTTVDVLLAVHAAWDSLHDDPRWPTILDNVTTAIDAGNLDTAAGTLRTFLRTPTAAGPPNDAMIREASDTAVATLANTTPRDPALMLTREPAAHGHRRQSDAPARSTRPRACQGRLVP
jgi:hypothetical protein